MGDACQQNATIRKLFLLKVWIIGIFKQLRISLDEKSADYIGFLWLFCFNHSLNGTVLAI
jgi:hypothetical protein